MSSPASHGLLEKAVPYLTPLHIGIGIPALLFVYLFVHAIYDIFFHPLAKFPGPFAAKFTRLWITWQCYKEREPYVLQELSRKYGPVVRITPALLHVSDATKLPAIYSRHAHKSKHYITGSFGATESLFHMQMHEEHNKYRKAIAGPYMLSHMKKNEPMIDRHTVKWIRRLDEQYAQSGTVFDFSQWPVFWAYDVVSELGFGGPFGFIDRGEDIDDLISGYHAGLHLFGAMGRMYPITNFVKKFPWFANKYMIARPENDDGIGKIMRFRDTLIEQRLSDIRSGKFDGRPDLLQSLLEIKTADGKLLEFEHIKTEVFIILVAGADTVGTTIQALLDYIMRDARVYEKLMVELDECTRSGKLSAVPQFTEVLENCPYYMACVKETQRLCPPAPSLFPRLAPKGGMDLYGQIAPEGTELTCNPYVVHRDPALYGPDFEAFRPERWLEDDTRAALFAKYQFGFGYGSRICLGKEFARMELYKGPLQFLRCFKPILTKDQPKYHIAGGESWFTDMWIGLERRPGADVLIRAE